LAANGNRVSVSVFIWNWLEHSIPIDVKFATAVVTSDQIVLIPLKSFTALGAAIVIYELHGDSSSFPLYGDFLGTEIVGTLAG
jgi:hypothetical protein